MGAVQYLDSHEEEVARRIDEAVRRVVFLGSASTAETIRRWVLVAAWLLVFCNAPVPATVMIVVGVLVNTLFASMYLRPKLAADRSRVLNFYWMSVGLVAGVYTFGLAGILLGPILIGLLEAVVDTVTAGSNWRLVESEPDGSGPAIVGGSA